VTAKMRVLIVDDSAFTRDILRSVLSSDPELEVVGAAADPLIAREMIKELNPDVLTLDVEMPHMDGLAFLEKIMTLRPMPVIMVSTLTQKGTLTTLRALELGAVDFVAKPNGDLKNGLEQLASELIPKIKAAAQFKMRFVNRSNLPAAGPINTSGIKYASERMVIAIGASTGGVVALRSVLSRLPACSPPILVTQHMPPKYTNSLAERLNQVCPATVVEAENGQKVRPGHAYIAPGGRHLELKRSREGFICKVYEGDLVSGHCPSVDVLFNSFADSAGNRAVGAILTGMGRDGATGLLQMRRTGAMTIGQNEASCVVYGMPKVAYEIGAVQSEMSIDLIAPAILKACVQPANPRQRVS